MRLTPRSTTGLPVASRIRLPEVRSGPRNPPASKTWLTGAELVVVAVDRWARDGGWPPAVDRGVDERPAALGMSPCTRSDSPGAALDEAPLWCSSTSANGVGRDLGGPSVEARPSVR